MAYDEYFIDVEMVDEYIRYLLDYKKKLEENLIEFEKMVKAANEYWNDQQYDALVEAKDKIALAELELIHSIEESIRNLAEMNEYYTIYLNM